jgi:hypothetical protein
MSGVTVIVPTWNRRDLLERLLGNLSSQTHPVEEILVVDNGSQDGSAEAAGSAGARVIRLDRNEGFSRAVNRGIREARSPWIAVVNNDVEPEPGWLERLKRGCEESQAWFATGRLLDAAKRDSIDGAFDGVSRGACAWRAGHGRPDGPEWRAGRRIRFAPLTAALFRRELFDKVGLLDERFESYLEDVEFGLRCALAGCEGVYVPDAVAFHQGSATLGRWHRQSVRLISRNQVLLVARHYPRRWFLRYGWPVLVGQALWGAVAFRHGAGLAWLRGKADALGEFRAARGPGAEHVKLGRILEESERELLELQRRTGFDLYWRLYFALT